MVLVVAVVAVVAVIVCVVAAVAGAGAAESGAVSVSLAVAVAFAVAVAGVNSFPSEQASLHFSRVRRNVVRPLVSPSKGSMANSTCHLGHKLLRTLGI